MSTGSAIGALLPSEQYSALYPTVHGFPSGRRAGAQAGGPFVACLAPASPLLGTARNAAAFTSRNPMTAARRRVVRKILVAALVGIPWIPIAAALYAWIG